MKSKRVIIDTNLWISFLIKKDYLPIDNLIEDRKIVLIFSQELIEEFVMVTQRPKFQKYFTPDSLIELLRLFDKFGKLIEVKSKTNICRDLKDNFLLNLAKDGKVDYLVTGDQDLIAIECFHNTKILTFKQLIEAIT